jgi:fatty acid desaturase
MHRIHSHSLTPIPQRANSLVIFVQLIALFACYVAAARTRHAWQTALVALLFGIAMNSVYSVIHEAEHAMLFNNRRINDLAGSLLCLFFPAPFHLIRQGHIGHHLRNRSDDEAFDLYFDGDNALLRWLVMIGILTGVYYLVVVLSNIAALFTPFVFDRSRFKIEQSLPIDRASAAFLEAFNPAYLRWIRLEALAAVALQCAIVHFLRIPIAHYLALYGSFGFMWSAMQYVHHFGMDRHVTRGTRDLYILAPIDLLWLHHNWHRVHHEHPTVPWIYLPRLANRAPREFLPWCYLKMWRGPAKTTEHVENKYAGRIIQ